MILWAVSTLTTKAYIGASCHGVVRRFVQRRWRAIDPRVSLIWFLSLKIFVCLVTVTRYFPSRVLMTFSLALHAGATHGQSLCSVRIRLLFPLLVAELSLSAERGVFVYLALYLAVCGLASVEFSCSLSTLVKLAGSRSATYSVATALLSARGRHRCIWRLSCCMLYVGHQYNLELAASHRLGYLCFSWHVWSRCSFLQRP